MGSFVSELSTSSEPEPGSATPLSPEPQPHPDAFLGPQLQVNAPAKQLPSVTRNAKFRRSCFFEASLRAGAVDWCTFNHMLIPSRYDWYESPNEEYEHLKKHVCIWDVAVERQLEISGPDAVKLAEFLTPRPLGDMKIGQCRFAIITDDEGMVVNDPVVSRIAEDKFWLSASDGDLILWAKGLAVGRGWKVKVTEAAVSPVAVQGPKSTAMMADLFGDWVYDLKYFHFEQVTLDGMPIALARSGWSPEVGYELYLQDESRGNELYERLMEVGQKYKIKPGSPNQKRRIEGGMLNFQSDITPHHNILELGLPPSWVGAPGACKAADFVAKEALQRLHEGGGAQRRVVGLELSGSEACPVLEKFMDIKAGSAMEDGRLSVGTPIGKLTSLTHSPALDAWIGIATVGVEAAAPGTEVCVETPAGPRAAVVKKLPFLPRSAMLPRPQASALNPTEESGSTTR